MASKGCWLAVLVGTWAGCAGPSTAVLTQHNDNGRTGATLAETILDTANVTPARFGRVARLPLRGAVFAQPLYVPDVALSGRHTGVVVVATTHNLVYGLAAGGVPDPLWGPVSLGPPINLPDPEIGPGDYKDVYGEVGIMSTPVIAPAQQALFVVAATKEGSNFVHRLHRLDLRTGQAQRPPVVIAAPGFESRRQSQRSALLWSAGRVYVAFASYGDRGDYRGWVFAYDGDTLARRAVFATTVPSGGGGVWMAGQGPAADAAGSLYFLTGNGKFVPAASPLATTQLGDSLLELAGDGLGLRSWFSPANNARLDREDGDLGGAGPLLIPGTRLVVGAGKEARVFVLERDHLGFFDAAADDRQPGVAQRFFANRERCPEGQLGGPNCHHVHGSPVFWAGPNGPWIYVWPENDFLKAFLFDRATGRIDCRGAPDPDCDPVSRSTTTDPERVPGGSRGMPGGFLSVSAHGGRAGTGIVWALHPFAGNANQRVVDGVLRAYDATDLSRELWSSRMVPERDDLGPYPKFVAPTVAAGRVYAPTLAGLTGQHVLDDRSDEGPALGTGPGGRLYLAWTAPDGRLFLRVSDDGRAFGHRWPLGGTSGHGPALAGDDRFLFVAWIGPDGAPALARAADPAAGFAPIAEGTHGAAPSGADAAPALAVVGGRVYLAWTRGDRRLALRSAPVDAPSLADEVTLPDEALGPPTLAGAGDRAWLAWTDPDHHLRVAAVGTDGRSLTRAPALARNSDTGPALAAVRPTGAPVPDLHLFWSGREDGRLAVTSADGLQPERFAYEIPFEDRSSVRPAAATFGRDVLIAWRGNDPERHLNIARYVPGELSVYGLLDRR